jgi:hypothetical protein
MPLAAIIGKDDNGCILRADDSQAGGGGLLVLGIVQGIIRSLYLVVLLKLVSVKVIAAGPAEDKEAEEAQQKQETGLGGFTALNIRRVVYQGTRLMLRGDVHIHEKELVVF